MANLLDVRKHDCNSRVVSMASVTFAVLDSRCRKAAEKIERRDRERSKHSCKHIDQKTVVGLMPRGDAARGAGLVL